MLFGFLALLAGNQGHVSHVGDTDRIALIVINALISMAAGGLTAFFVRRTWGACYGHHSSVLTMINGSLTGAVRFNFKYYACEGFVSPLKYYACEGLITVKLII